LACGGGALSCINLGAKWLSPFPDAIDAKLVSPKVPDKGATKLFRRFVDLIAASKD